MWNCIFILIKLIKQYIFFGEKIKPFSLNMYTYAFINLRTTKHVLHQAELHSFTFDTNKEVPDGQREDDEDAVFVYWATHFTRISWLVGFSAGLHKTTEEVFPPNLDDNVLHAAERLFKIRHK